MTPSLNPWVATNESRTNAYEEKPVRDHAAVGHASAKAIVVALGCDVMTGAGDLVTAPEAPATIALPADVQVCGADLEYADVHDGHELGLNYRYFLQGLGCAWLRCKGSKLNPGSEHFPWRLR